MLWTILDAVTCLKCKIVSGVCAKSVLCEDNCVESVCVKSAWQPFVNLQEKTTNAYIYLLYSTHTPAVSNKPAVFNTYTHKTCYVQLQ